MRNEELVIGNYKNCSLLITNYSLLMGVGDYSAYASSLGFFCFGWWGWGRGGIIRNRPKKAGLIFIFGPENILLFRKVVWQKAF